MMASPPSSSMAFIVVGVVIVTADRLPAALTSTNRMVSSTPMSWLGCLRRSSASARPMQSWSATLSSPWSQIWSQLVHFLVKRQTSAWAANERIGSPLSCIILLRATLGFSSLTASARMAFSRFSSVKSSRCKGPTQFRVTSRLNLVSQHSRSWMVVSFPCSSTACEYDLQRVRK